MKINRRILLAVSVVALVAISASAQVYKYYAPGSVWTITSIRIKPGMDQAYISYLDGQFKSSEDAQVKAGYQKSYKILRTMDDDADSYNLIILREYASLASMEANTEKADALSMQTVGDDTKQMQGYEDRSKIREIISTRTARELMLK